MGGYGTRCFASQTIAGADKANRRGYPRVYAALPQRVLVHHRRVGIMLILTIRTDKPEAEIGLFDNDQQLTYETWQAHRQLAETIHKKIEATLHSQNKGWHDIAGIVAFEGPG